MLTRLIGLTLKNACQLGFRRFSTDKKNGIISSFNSMLSGIGSRFRSISKIVSKQVSTLEALEKLNTEEYSGLRENLRNLKEQTAPEFLKYLRKQSDNIDPGLIYYTVSNLLTLIGKGEISATITKSQDYQAMCEKYPYLKINSLLIESQRKLKSAKFNWVTQFRKIKSTIDKKQNRELIQNLKKNWQQQQSQNLKTIQANMDTCKSLLPQIQPSSRVKLAFSINKILATMSLLGTPEQNKNKLSLLITALESSDQYIEDSKKNMREFLTYISNKKLDQNDKEKLLKEYKSLITKNTLHVFSLRKKWFENLFSNIYSVKSLQQTPQNLKQNIQTLLNWINKLEKSCKQFETTSISPHNFSQYLSDFSYMKLCLEEFRESDKNPEIKKKCEERMRDYTSQLKKNIINKIALQEFLRVKNLPEGQNDKGMFQLLLKKQIKSILINESLSKEEKFKAVAQSLDITDADKKEKMSTILKNLQKKFREKSKSVSKDLKQEALKNSSEKK